MRNDVSQTRAWTWLIFLKLESFLILITPSMEFGNKRFVALNPPVSFSAEF